MFLLLPFLCEYSTSRIVALSGGGTAGTVDIDGGGAGGPVIQDGLPDAAKMALSRRRFGVTHLLSVKKKSKK